MAKTRSKHQNRRDEVNKLNRTALLIGGVSAVIILLLMLLSIFM